MSCFERSQGITDLKAVAWSEIHERTTRMMRMFPKPKIFDQPEPEKEEEEENFFVFLPRIFINKAEEPKDEMITKVEYPGVCFFTTLYTEKIPSKLMQEGYTPKFIWRAHYWSMLLYKDVGKVVWNLKRRTSIWVWDHDEELFAEGYPDRGTILLVRGRIKKLSIEQILGRLRGVMLEGIHYLKRLTSDVGKILKLERR